MIIIITSNHGNNHDHQNNLLAWPSKSLIRLHQGSNQVEGGRVFHIDSDGDDGGDDHNGDCDDHNDDCDDHNDDCDDHNDDCDDWDDHNDGHHDH